MPKNILLVASASGIGGGEKNVLDIAGHFSKMSGYKVFAVAPCDGPLVEHLSGMGVGVSIAPMPSILHPGSILAIRSFIKRWRVDLIHAHGTRAALYARVAARFAGRAPCIYTIHGLHYVHYSNKLLRALFTFGERFLIRWTKKFVCVCRADLEKCRTFGVIDADKATVIYNGLEDSIPLDASEVEAIRRQFNIRDTDRCVLHASRFHPQKGQSYLIDAIPKVIDAHPSTKFILVGDGELYDTLKAQARRLNFPEGKVTFTGQRGDVNRLMQACDMFVLSSLWEGLPYVVIEAMAAGKPVVSTDVDGVSEALVDGKTGLLVKPGDSNALAGAIIDLLPDDKRIERYGVQARERFIEKFTIDRMYRDIEKLYLETLS